MPITAQQKSKILQVVNVFETGTKEGDYANVSIYADGPVGPDGKKIKQITYGRSQTTEFGILKVLLQQYITNNGTYANAFKPYIAKMGKQPSMYADTVLIKALKDAGKLDPIMKTTQDVFFDQLYYQPAFNWFASMKFTLPLSLLVIYDSQIHSGGILAFLRERFTESVPKNGGNEQTWIKQYVDARHEWLKNHSNKILRATTYRTECFQDAIAKGNWDFAQPIKVREGITV